MSTYGLHGEGSPGKRMLNTLYQFASGDLEDAERFFNCYLYDSVMPSHLTGGFLGHVTSRICKSRAASCSNVLEQVGQ
jgi:hypothetical protein